jgi:hemolysin III
MTEQQNEGAVLWKRGLREPFCGISHMVGAGLSIVALVILLVLAHGRPWHTVSFAIYGASLIVLYTASTLYHSLRVSPRYADRLMRFDHSAIYFLIAGTYTPVCLLLLRNAWGWSIFGVEYGLAFTGMFITMFWKRAPDWVRVVLYLIMGWLIVIAMSPLRHAIPPAAMTWLVAGGVTYSIGCAIFAANRPHLIPGKFMAHDLWHCFVLGGSACHFIMMLQLLPAS